MKKDIQEKIAQELGFKADKYYTAKQKMFRSATTSPIMSIVSKKSLKSIVQFELDDIANRFCDW